MKASIFLHIALLSALFFSGCKKEDVMPTANLEPSIVNLAAEVVADKGVVLSATISAHNNETIKECGFLVSSIPNPLYLNSEFSCKKELSTPNYSILMSTNLTKGTTYYARAYIAIDNYIVYSDEISFISKGGIPASIKSMSPINGIDLSTVTIDGEWYPKNLNSIKVFLNEIECNITSITNNQLKFIIPSSTLIGDAYIRMQIEDASFNVGKFHVDGPVFNSFSTVNAFICDTITLNGANLLLYASKPELHLNGCSNNPYEYSNNQIKFTIPLWAYNDMFNDYELDVTFINGNKKIECPNKITVKTQWHPITNLPENLNYWSNTAISYNNKGYMFNYRDNYLYEYNPDLNSWIQKSLYPDEIPLKPILVINNEKLLVLGGTFSAKVWEYDFNSNTWTKKNNLPFENDEGLIFTIGRNVYWACNTNKVFRYNLDNETCVEMRNLPREYGILNYTNLHAYCDNGKGYYVTVGKTYIYDEASDSWEVKINNIENYDYTINLGGFDIDGKHYVTNGYPRIYCYDPKADIWRIVAGVPNPGYGESIRYACFTIGTKAYFIGDLDNIWHRQSAYYETKR